MTGDKEINKINIEKLKAIKEKQDFLKKHSKDLDPEMSLFFKLPLTLNQLDELYKDIIDESKKK